MNKEPHCNCCGLELTDWIFLNTGVEPVCSKSLDMPDVKKEQGMILDWKKNIKPK